MLGVSAKTVSTPVARFLFFFSAKLKNTSVFFGTTVRFLGQDERVHFESMAKEHEEQKANLEEPNFGMQCCSFGGSWGMSLRSSQKPEFTHRI